MRGGMVRYLVVKDRGVSRAPVIFSLVSFARPSRIFFLLRVTFFQVTILATPGLEPEPSQRRDTRTIADPVPVNPRTYRIRVSYRNHSLVIAASNTRDCSKMPRYL